MTQAETAVATAVKASPAPPKKSKGGRPPKSEDRVPKVMGFVDRIQRIAKEDWGARATIRVYRTEPSVDRVRLGEPKHICVYSEPVDEERIKADHGSGRYRLYLNFKEPTSREGKEIDSIEIDILDTRFPPKLAPGEWLDIPHNNKWLWCKPLLQQTPNGQPPPATGLAGVADTLRAVNEIQESAREAMNRSNPVDDLATVVTVAQNLAALQKPAENNSDLLKQFLASNESQLASLRAELAAQRLRSDALMDRLLDAKNKPEPPAAQTGIDTVVKLVEGLGKLKDAMPSDGTVRSRLSPWMEFFQPVLPAVADILRPVAGAIATAAMQSSPAPSNEGPKVVTINAAAATPDKFKRLLATIVDPAITFIKDGTSGADFAMFIYDGWGPAPLYAARKAGADAIMTYYRTTEQWPDIAQHETQFHQLLADVIAWPIPEEQEQPPQSEVPVVDLDVEPVGAN